jgi:hypothetical protein
MRFNIATSLTLDYRYDEPIPLLIYKELDAINGMIVRRELASPIYNNIRIVIIPLMNICRYERLIFE